MDEKKNESVLPEEEVTAVEVTDEAPEITAIDENILETDALQTQQESPAEVATAQEGVEAVQAQKEPESEGDAGTTGKKPLSTQKLLIIILL